MKEKEFTIYTTAMFRHLYEFVADVLPGELREEMQHALMHIEAQPELSRDDIEQTMIVFGKKVWPHRKALQESIELHEGKMGPQFFRSNLSRQMQRRFEEFLHHGGTLQDIHSGAPAQFFSADERAALNHALVDLHQHLRSYVLQHIRGLGADEFSSRVDEFRGMLQMLEEELDHIRTMADDAQEHPLLAREMREHVKGFEHGIVLLGPEYSHEQIAQARDHFVGRKRELVVRGLEISLS